MTVIKYRTEPPRGGSACLIGGRCKSKKQSSLELLRRFGITVYRRPTVLPYDRPYAPQIDLLDWLLKRG